MEVFSAGSSSSSPTVCANDLLLKLDNVNICRYKVTILMIKDRGEISLQPVSSNAVRRNVIGRANPSEWGRKNLAYDGGAYAYVAGPTPPTHKIVCQATLGEDDWRRRVFSIEMDSDSHLGNGDAMQQALSVIFKTAASQDPTTLVVGNAFFPSSQSGSNDDQTECWLYYREGFFLTVRNTEIGFLLNFDVLKKPFYKAVKLTKFIEDFLGKNDDDLKRNGIGDKDLEEQVKNALHGILVETNHRRGHVARLKVLNFTEEKQGDIRFKENRDSRPIKVTEYFARHYHNLLYNKFPMIKYKTKQGEYASDEYKYMPMEVCIIVKDQICKQKLSNCGPLKVEDRMNIILKLVRQNIANWNDYLKEFGIEVNTENLVKVPARIIGCPKLLWTDRYTSQHCDEAKTYFGCINFSSIGHVEMQGFCRKLATACNRKNMVYFERFLRYAPGNPNDIRRSLQNVCKNRTDQKVFKLLIVVLPEKANNKIYGTIKRVCEIELGVVSQCLNPQKVRRSMDLNDRQSLSDHYLENVALKINIKVGGSNVVLDEATMPLPNDEATIIFGADVTHNPSIAAVVGSMDWPGVSMYRGVVSGQKPRVEIIEDLQKMISELLRNFCDVNKDKGVEPKRIIFFRDGIGEKQFKRVLEEEWNAIREASKDVFGVNIPITFILVQKRHHTRLFYRNGDEIRNIDKGTVVDNVICHPTKSDFFLCSHGGTRGTSHCTHYNILLDENKFKFDELETLTNHLCNLYAKSRNPLSVVPCTHYAHLLAFRARYYVERDFSGEMATEKLKLPELRENIKNVMFYC